MTTVEEDSITINGITIPYVVKLSTKAKHIRLEMRRETGFTAVLPRHCSVKQLRDLLKARQGWIIRNFTKYRKFESLSVRKEIRVGDVIPYLGQELKVLTIEKSGKTAHVRLKRDSVIVGTSGNKKLNVILEKWYRTQATKQIKERLEKWSARLDVSYNKIAIRGQKTRWGSCSSKGNLNFNWKLLTAPGPVIDYVIIHELTHLKEMNHSKRFWQLVAEHCPSWREHKKWLKIHEAQLAAGLIIPKLPSYYT